VEPSFVRAELADRAPHSQSPTRTHAEERKLQSEYLCAALHASTGGHGGQSSLAARVEGAPIADYERVNVVTTPAVGYAPIIRL
jgi:hypothetical protein